MKKLGKKKNRIYLIISALLHNRYLKKDNHYVEQHQNYTIAARKLTERILKYRNHDEFDLEVFLREYTLESDIFEDITDAEEFVKECTSKIEAIINVSDKKAMSEVVTRWFNRVFEDQISPLMNEEIESEIELTIKDRTISYLFKENICKDWNSEIDLLHAAFYIDNPFVIDKMSIRHGVGKITERRLLDNLHMEKDIFDGIFDGIFDAVMAKDKLNEIYSLLSEVVDGDIVENQDGEYCLRLKECVKPLLVKNLSTGLKSFALIKMLLEKGCIKEKDVLILDEPEIHLHPEWQLLYAKLIVLLQKEFDLSIIITTHSPYFLDAIDVYSSIYNTSNSTHFYMAENKGNVSSLQDVTGNIDEIYKKLSDPMQTLENLRYSIR